LKPVAIFRFANIDGPAYFADWLTSQGIPWTEIRIDQGATVPTDPDDFSGIGMMGGPMSVNDPLPWIEPMLDLIRQAQADGVPLIGHCLGGQLLSRALGGTVGTNTRDGEQAKEIGWHTIRPEPNEAARQWLGDAPEYDVFQWHGETFSIPPGATHLASSGLCDNQMFAIGPSIGMQCHIEMDEPTLSTWCEGGVPEVAQALAGPRPGGVQDAATVHALTAERLPRMRQLTTRIYHRWADGLPRD